MNRTRRLTTYFLAAAVIFVLGYLWSAVMLVMTRDEANDQGVRADEAETGQAQAEANQRATLAAIGARCRAGDLPRELRFLCDQRRQLINQVDPDDPETQESEIQEPEVQEGERQDPEYPDSERQDPERDDPETQDGEVDDPEAQDDELQDSEIDDPDPDDPETQDPEIQNDERDDPEPNDPQDPAATVTYTFPFGTFVCTRDHGSDPRNPTYTCDQSTPQS